jgi:hypothetical protein
MVMYARDFKLIIPITAQENIRDVERKMSEHFGGVSTFPLVKGYWVDPDTHKLVEDENLMLSSVRDYSKQEHPYTKLHQDEEFMESLAKEVGAKTHQKSILVEEDLVAKCTFVEIHPKAREKYEQVV